MFPVGEHPSCAGLCLPVDYSNASTSNIDVDNNYMPWYKVKQYVIAFHISVDVFIMTWTDHINVMCGAT